MAATQTTEYLNTEMEMKIQDKTPITVACALVNVKPSKSVDCQYDLPTHPSAETRVAKLEPIYSTLLAGIQQSGDEISTPTTDLLPCKN